MRQYEAVIKVMERHGGYATLSILYQEALKVKGCIWRTKTPFASIRRIVQDERFFFKIKPGLWALKSYKDKLPIDIKSQEKENYHTYYQGLLVEIGNLRKYQTFIPNQDKNRKFLGKKLSEIASLSHIYEFSYDDIVRRAQTIDVIWFNERKMPANFYEVEHSTDFMNSLSKFAELQDFHSTFCIVADKTRKREFYDRLSFAIFKPIRKRVIFWSYDDVVELHSKASEIVVIESRLNLLSEDIGLPIH